MSFASDNWAGASDRVMAALAEANAGLAPAYGADPWTERARRLLSDFFEREVSAHFVATGGAANAVALASYARPGGVVICHADAHIARDEAGAPTYFAPSLSLDPLDGPAGRMEPDALAARLASYTAGVVHHGRPVALSLTNVNEFGQCYAPGEVAALADLAHSRGMAVHMDGARFLNALAQLGVAPADLTWRAGVDVLSLGLTKAGAWCAEVVVHFDASMGEEVAYCHKQAAQLLSKNRFVAAQVAALIGDGHGLALARHANAVASALGACLAASDHAALAFPVQSNEVFAFVSEEAARALAEANIAAYPWAARSAHLPAAPEHGWVMHRFVASFRSGEADVGRVAETLRRLPARHPAPRPQAV